MLVIQVACLWFRLHACDSSCMLAIQAACLRFRLHACDSGCMLAIQVACLWFRLHTCDSGCMRVIQVACVWFRLHAYDSGCTRVNQDTWLKIMRHPGKSRYLLKSKFHWLCKRSRGIIMVILDFVLRILGVILEIFCLYFGEFWDLGIFIRFAFPCPLILFRMGIFGKFVFPCPSNFVSDGHIG